RGCGEIGAGDGGGGRGRWHGSHRRNRHDGSPLVYRPTPGPGRELAVRTLQVSEIFYSIQGEGVSCGQAAAFIRLGGCTLGCQWCDTKYTWRGGPVWEEQRILDTVKGLPSRRVVVTGGEPFEQDIVSLLHAL